jgi:anti-sigma-K factor RskA
MHREIRDQIEDVLADGKPASAGDHLAKCGECRAEIQTMRNHAELMRELRAPAGFDAEPRPGFYARVRERIEAEGAASIWNLFIESAFGRRIAMASLALAVLLGVYLVSSERTAEVPLVAMQPAHQALSLSSSSSPEPLIVPGEDEPV